MPGLLELSLLLVLLVLCGGLDPAELVRSRAIELGLGEPDVLSLCFCFRLCLCKLDFGLELTVWDLGLWFCVERCLLVLLCDFRCGA